jgi:hypothetical protein
MSNQEHNRLFKTLLLFPPLLGFIISIRDALVEKSKQSLLNYVVMLSVFIAFFFPTYDSMLRMRGIRFGKLEWSNFFLGDPLSNIATIFNPYIDSIYFISFYIFLVFFLFYKTIVLNYDDEKLPLSVVFIVLCGLPLRHGADTTYSTLATVLSLYLCSKYNLKYLYYIPILIVSYLCHPFILLVLVPAMVSNWIFVHNKPIFGFLFFLVYGMATYSLFNGFNLSFNITSLLYEEMFIAFNNYTNSDSIWGSAGRNLGLKYTLFVCFICMQFLICAIVVFFKNKDLFKQMSFSYMFLSGILLYNCYDFYSFRERSLIALSISATVLFCEAISTNSVKDDIKKFFSLCVIAVWGLSFFAFPQPRYHLFCNEGWDVSIIGGALLPGIVSVSDMHHFGYSDAYLNQNATAYYRFKR